MAEYEVGKKYIVTKENGKKSTRMCIGKLEDRYLAEQKSISKSGFAPMFIKDGYVWLALPQKK